MPEPSIESMPAPGVKSTEFWLSAATSALGLLMGIGLLTPASPVAIVAGAALTLAPTLLYTWRRSHLKGVIAIASAGWDVYKQLAAAGKAPPLMMVQAPSPSLRPVAFTPPATMVPGAVPQATDDEDPRR